MNTFWLLQTLGYGAAVLYMVPKTQLRKLAIFTLVGGLVYTTLVQLIAVPMLSIWQFRAGIFHLFDIPVFFITSWTLVTVLYGYLLAQYPRYQLYILLFFVAWTGITQWIAEALGQVTLVHWTLWQTLMFALFSHVVLLFLLKWLLKIDSLGTKENLLLLGRSQED